MAGPNTHREALIAELLGDAGKLVDRIEALNASIPKTVKEAKAELASSVTQAGEHITEACVRLSRLIDQHARETTTATTTAVREVQRAAAVVQLAKGRLVVLLVALPLLAGGLAGAGVYLALRLVIGR